MYAFEQEAAAQGFAAICGVDEAGRGPLAGDVYAAAVILPEGLQIEGVNDSKKLTERRRDQLFDQICAKSRSWCIATAHVEEIDRLNILEAAMLAMRRAVEGLSIVPDLALVDGNRGPHFEGGLRCRTIIKGDALSASIAAASILAKVARDRYMVELAEQYPLYQFGKHKGYPTKLHYELLDAYGPSAVHRQSFLKKWNKARGL